MINTHIATTDSFPSSIGMSVYGRALGAVVGVAGLIAIFARGTESDLVPMGSHYVLRPPDPPKPRQRWRLTIERR